MLPCSHSVCKRCLQDISDSNNKGNLATQQSPSCYRAHIVCARGAYRISVTVIIKVCLIITLYRILETFILLARPFSVYSVGGGSQQVLVPLLEGKKLQAADFFPVTEILVVFRQKNYQFGKKLPSTRLLGMLEGKINVSFIFLSGTISSHQRTRRP